MMKKIKRFFCFVGNLMPPPLNKYLYYFSGVKFENLKKTWIGANCYFDNYDPSLITIESGVCISFRVTIITHFDPTNSIDNPKIKKFSKPVSLKKKCFIGANSTIYPGVTIGSESIISSGLVITNSIEGKVLVKNDESYKKKKFIK